jgi:Kdo2-lipid IVA lauroyltransferase/acyltransferase
VNGKPPAANAAKGAEKPRRWSKPLEWWLTRGLVRGLSLVGACTPRAALAPLGRGLGMLAYHTMTRYRKVAHANLRRAYGESWSEAERERVARESFRHLGITLVEFFLRQPRISPEEVEREVRFEGQEHFEAAFARGKGVLLVTAHYGNWEMMGPRLARAGYTVSAVSRTADDPGLERMIETIRTRCGLRQIPRRQAARQGLAALRRNEILAILLDQNTLEGGIFVPFFGYPASTATGPALFSMKTGAALVPTFCLREADGTHTMKAWPPIYPEAAEDRAKTVENLTAAVTHVIELQIRERPELWCWLHNRWKVQPADAGIEPEAPPARGEKGPVECKPCD